MATTTDGTPIVFCCPPGKHEHLPCGRTWLINEQFFTPASRVWFSQSWIHAVWLCGYYPRWNVDITDRGVMARFRAADSTRYVWRLTDEYLNDRFLRLGRWPD